MRKDQAGLQNQVKNLSKRKNKYKEWCVKLKSKYKKFKKQMLISNENQEQKLFSSKTNHRKENIQK